MENITPHITYREATHSNIAIRNGIVNAPGPKELANMKMWGEKIFEPLRAYVSAIRGVDTPIHIESLFRNIETNAKAGGSDTSSHCCGIATGIEEAAGDIETNYPDFTNKHLFAVIKERLSFDQLIWEFGDDDQPAWVHVSFRRYDNRMQVLRAKVVYNKTKKKNETKYETF